MNKFQVLVILAIIALAVYYFSPEESKPKPAVAPKPPKQPFMAAKPSILPPSFISPPATRPPVINLPPDEIIARKPSPLMPLAINVPEPKLNLPDGDFVLAPDNPDDYYRQQVLGFLEDGLASFTNPQQKSKTTPVISLLQAENKPRGEYLPALGSLRAMEGFEFYVGQSFSEGVNLPVEKKPAYAPLDTGWLTDDNLEFILRNSPQIQAALTQKNQACKVFHLRTDIANVYNAFYKAQSKQIGDLAEFLQELEGNKAQYTLFPLRVNGNHWGLVILEDKENAYQVGYTSSGGGSLEVEKEQLKPFISQICGEGTEIKIIEPADRESKGYECGVYLVKYVEEILERGELELKRKYSVEECQGFRWEGKERIGERWCLG